MRAEHTFCDLPGAALQTFETMKYATAYPKGAVLFVEGQAPRGIFVLCKGRVKLSICASDGKTLILKIAEAGEVLGLSANVRGTPYELTAETVDPCQVNFVKREDFQRLLRQHSDACLHVAEQLSALDRVGHFPPGSRRLVYLIRGFDITFRAQRLGFVHGQDALLLKLVQQVIHGGLGTCIRCQRH